MLLARAEARDAETAHQLMDDAMAAYRELGMAARWETHYLALEPDPTPSYPWLVAAQGTFRTLGQPSKRT